jgi:hypothetical protein
MCRNVSAHGLPRGRFARGALRLSRADPCQNVLACVHLKVDSWQPSVGSECKLPTANCKLSHRQPSVGMLSPGAGVS